MKNFVSFSFDRLFVEELKLHHPGFANVSVSERERVKTVNDLIGKITSFK